MVEESPSCESFPAADILAGGTTQHSVCRKDSLGHVHPLNYSWKLERFFESVMAFQNTGRVRCSFILPLLRS